MTTGGRRLGGRVRRHRDGGHVCQTRGVLRVLPSRCSHRGGDGDHSQAQAQRVESRQQFHAPGGPVRERGDPTSNRTASSSVSSSEPVRDIDVKAAETNMQGFYQCSWDVLSNYSSEPDEACCSLVDSEDERR